jgi:NADH-quinone oxidoreductase subunit D
MAMELGAFTPFLWYVKAARWSGTSSRRRPARALTHSFGRVGGMAKPPTPDFKDMVEGRPRRVIRQVIAEGEKLLLKNRIFLDRSRASA